MANNYGPPPPLGNNSTEYYYPDPSSQQQQQQQHQSERISGDGEEVYGYSNYLRQVPPSAAAGPQTMLPPIMAPPAAGLPVSQGSGQGDPPNHPTPPPMGVPPVASNPYEQQQQYDYSVSSHPLPQHNLLEQHGANQTQNPRPSSIIQDNRTVDGEDQFFSYYSLRRRRRETDSFRAPRGPPSDYDPREYYSRDMRNSFGYVEHPAPSGSFALPSARHPYYAPASLEPQPHINSHAQSFQMYLATFRIQNPAQYREWYHKYLAHMLQPTRIPFPPVPGFTPAKRAASTTGAPESLRPRSAAGGALVADENAIGQDDSRFFRPIKEDNLEPTLPARSTPLTFPTPHAIARFSSMGFLIRNRYGNHNVELINVKQLVKRLPEYKEMRAFPGPLIKGVTHKKTVIDLCHRKIRELQINESQLDQENLILLWELLVLLISQNGSAIGSDVAELLLKSKSTGRTLDSDVDPESETEEQNEVETRKGNSVNVVQRYQSNDSDQKCVEVFCQQLIYGRKREALEYAMDNALWGHALFFASKMDERLYGSVLARFANSTMPLSSPLQTLYHVLSGKQPPSVQCCGDETFGDWKPHLAMILSNMGQRPEYEATTIRTLGRNLANRNMKFAAEFCYLMAETEFSEDSDIGPLLGYNPTARNKIEATQMTEIYEYARSLGHSDFSLGASFIERKRIYAQELINLGLIEEAYAYCEEMAKTLRKHRIHTGDQVLVHNILFMAERLINCDSSRESGDPSWIEDLRKMADLPESETTSRKLSIATSSSDHIDEANLNYQSAYTGSENLPNYNAPEVQPQVQQHPLVSKNNDNLYAGSNQWSQNSSNQPGEQYVPAASGMNYYQPQEINNFQQPVPNFQTNGPLYAPASDNNNYWPPYEQSSKRNSGLPGEFQSNNSISNSAPSKNYIPQQQPPTHHEQQSQPTMGLPSQGRPPPSTQQENKSKTDEKRQQKGWLSGMFSKISLKPKNQMILPDDKEPKIVWDPNTKSWKNTSGDDEEDSAPKGPPPKDSDLLQQTGPPTQSVPNVPTQNAMPMQSTPLPSNGLPKASNSTQPNFNMNGSAAGIPPPSSGGNKFQRPKGLRPKYVDVFNSNGNAMQKAEEPSVPLPGGLMPGPGMPNMFMPLPSTADSGPTSFLTSSMDINNSEETNGAQVAAPPMFNPAQYQNQNIPNYGLNR